MTKRFAEFILLSIPAYLKRRRKLFSWESRLLSAMYLRAMGASRKFLWDDWQSFQIKKINALFPTLHKTGFFNRIMAERHVTSLKSLSDLDSFPVMTKNAIRGHIEQFISSLPPIWRKKDNFTSGSTGEPLHFYQDSAQILLRSWQSFHEARSIEPSVTFPALILGLGTHTYLDPLGKRFSSNDLESCRVRHEIIYPFIKQKGVTFLIGTPTMIERFRYFKEREMKNIVFKVIRSGGERLAIEMERKWEKSFSAKIMDVYGNRECGAIGIRCAKGTYHVKPWVTHVEIVDAEGASLPMGHEGHLLVTSLDNEVMPFIRYRTGDIAVIREAACECNDPAPHIAFQGRDAGEILLSSGKSVPVLKITTMVTKSFHREIKQYQIEEVRGGIRFRYQPTGFFTRNTEESLRRLFASIFLGDATCQLEKTEHFLHREEKIPTFIPKA